MFGKKPLRTYEKKRAGVYWRPHSPIFREDVPPEVDPPPQDTKSPNPADDTLDYDPFDTTFDRLVRDTRDKMPPAPPIRPSTAAYLDSSSSSGENDNAQNKNDESDADFVDDLFLNPEPIVQMPSKPKKRKSNEIRMKTATIIVEKRRAKKNRQESTGGVGADENLSLDGTATKEAAAVKKVVEQEKKGRRGRPRKTAKKAAIRKSDAIPKVHLMRLENLNVDGEIARKSLDENRSSGISPNSSTANYSNLSLKSLSIQLRKIDEKLPNLGISKRNPVISLNRLDLPKKSSIFDDFTSSTPLPKRFKMAVSKIPLSPININTIDPTMENREIGDTLAKSTTEKAEDQNKIEKSTIVVENDRTSESFRVPKTPETKNKVLSESTASQVSELLFDDTQQQSAAVQEKSKQSESPGSKDRKNMTDATSISTGPDSSDLESLQLVLEADEDLLPQKDSLDNEEVTIGESRNSLAIEESGKMDDSLDNEEATINESMNSLSIDESGKTKESDKFEESNEIHQFTQDQFSKLSISQNGEFPEDNGSLNKNGDNSDDEWATIDSRDENFSSKTDEKSIDRADSMKNDSINDKSKFFESTGSSKTSMDTTKFEETGQFSDHPTGVSIETTKSSTLNENNSRMSEKSEYPEISDEELRSMQPIVLLERLDGPKRKKLRKETVDKRDNEKAMLTENFTNSPHQMTKSTIIDSDSSTFSESISVAEKSNSQISKVNEVSGNMDESIVENAEKDGHEESSKSLSIGDTSNGIEKSSENLKNVDIDESNDSENLELELQPVVILSRLNDYRGITKRRKKYYNFATKFRTIPEDVCEMPRIDEDDVPEVKESQANTARNKSDVSGVSRDSFNGWKVSQASENSRIFSEKMLPPIDESTTQLENNKSKESFSQAISCTNSTVVDSQEEHPKDDRVLFLMPGKSWSRSLSILNQVHSDDDLEVLSIGKGKRWRESAKHLLEMQRTGLLQSCVKKNEDNKEYRPSDGLECNPTGSPSPSQPEPSRLFGVASPLRFNRRISIRVVPDSKNFEHIEDTPFLEAYGITPSQDRQTIAEGRALIAPFESFRSEENANKSFEESRFDTNEKSRNVVLAQCEQATSLPWEQCYPDSFLRRCRKIGEGVFGEVFLYEKNAERRVIKVIPIEGKLRINGERQKKFDEILSEIVIAKELHNLRHGKQSNTSSFVEVKNIKCVKGKYPPMLLELWKKWDDEKTSENDCPDIFDENQLYIVLELGHGGDDLEAFVFQNASEAHALFLQASLALAVAEEALEFEHRDLHWGNMLISRTVDPEIDFTLDDKKITVATKGVKVSVIDFTLSRVSYQGCTVFNDLAMDDDLFTAKGEYQFDIYRLMRQKVHNNWQTFEPFTNILWLHYTLDKMITAARYRRKNTKIHKLGINKLQELKDEILNYESAMDFVKSCDKVTRLQGSRGPSARVG